MAAKDRIGKAGEGALAAQGGRYIQRLIEDEELRSSLAAAYAAGRSAFGRMSNGTPPAQALFEDRKLQQELTDAANALRQAAGSLREPPEPVKSAKRRGGLGRPLLLIVVGSVLAVALSESLRAKVLDLLFGAEEEFDYTPTTAPEAPAPAGVAGG
jgi:hypothetical protein